jgi:two-component system, OmpR family, sensor histidine kinase PhoQ
VVIKSVSQRLLIWVTLLLLVFFGAMVAVLDARFQAVAQASLRELLDAQMVALIATAEEDAAGNLLPRLTTAESRLATPGSGLYAAVLGPAGELLWRSPSSVGSVVTFSPAQAVGSRDFRYSRDVRNERLAVVSRGLLWEGDSGRSRDLTFTVATSLEPYNQQLATFRRGLLSSFAILAAALLLTLALMLRWVLSPLRHLATQIRAVERGERAQLDAVWPSELAGVVSNLNTLLQAERTRIARYRDTLGNLAHSLKTPLAVLRSVVSGGGPIAQSVNKEVDRMSTIVEHQLRRAATSGGASVGSHAIAVLPIVQDLRSAMLKVHRAKDFSLEIAVPAQAMFVGDRDDLTEALGNVIDNAAKWCRSRVRVQARIEVQQGSGHRLHLTVEDDGPGVAAADRERVFERGARADEQVPGHGLGLAMVREMTELYGGSLELRESELGGALVELRLPGR